MWGRIGRALAVVLSLAAPLAPAWAADEIILYSRPNFQGDQLRVRGDVQNLREYDMNDEVSSVIVMDGEWGLFQHKDFGGRGVRLRPGSYPNMEAAGMEDDEISSVRLLTPTPPPPPPLPDLTREVLARAGYMGKVDGSGADRVATDIRFRGLTVQVQVTNVGAGPAAASTLRIDLSSKMTIPLSYVGKGVHPCAKRETPSPAKAGGLATCAAMRRDAVLATPTDDGLACAIPALKSGESALCIGVFSVLYNWMVPPFDTWHLTVTADAGKKVKEANEKNNGAGQALKFPGDDLPLP